MKISQIYVGKDHACRCGCVGKYITDPKLFTKYLKKIDNLEKDSVIIEQGYGNVNYSLPNNKAITLYFN